MNNDNKLTGNFKLKGVYRFRVVDQFGKVKEEQIIENLIPKIIRTKVADRFTNASPDSSLLIGYAAVGSGTTAPADGDTTLETEVARVAVTSRSHSDDVFSVSAVFGAGVATGTHREVGLFVEGSATPDSGILASHAAINITITALDSLFVDWRITVSDA